MADDKLTRYFGSPPGPPGPIQGVIVERPESETVDAELLSESPTAPVELTSQQLGYIHGLLFDRLKDPDDLTARAIYLELKAAAISLGVVWYYGDPPGLEGKG